MCVCVYVLGFFVLSVCTSPHRLRLSFFSFFPCVNVCPSPQVQTRSVANILAQLTCSSCHPVYRKHGFLLLLEYIDTLRSPDGVSVHHISSVDGDEGLITTTPELRSELMREAKHEKLLGDAGRQRELRRRQEEEAPAGGKAGGGATKEVSCWTLSTA